MFVSVLPLPSKFVPHNSLAVPDPPTDLHAINITDSRALLLWRPALAPVDNYVIVYGSEKGES